MPIEIKPVRGDSEDDEAGEESREEKSIFDDEAPESFQADLVYEHLNADPILPRLWQGAHPEAGDLLSRIGFTMGVFCAAELQPERIDYPGIDIARAPMWDDE